MQTFKAVSLNYKNAPVEVREAVALNEGSTKRILAQLRAITGLNELFILSTCNRTEFYYCSTANHAQEILMVLAQERHIKDIETIRSHFLFIDDAAQAVTHLFRVAMGLESQVVGDMQITNQVKQAYQWTADEDLAGPFLHRLLHTIFFTNKRVVQETAFRDGAASVSYAATGLVESFANHMDNPTILILGLGEIGKELCLNLSEKGFQGVTISNRTAAKADALANECGFASMPFDAAVNSYLDFDVVISSVSVQQPIITKAQIEKEEVLSYKYFIDLSVPRSIAEDIEDVPGILLYNIDKIQSRASEALNSRLAAVPQVEAIIADAMADFDGWAKEMEVSPTIHKLKNALEDIRKQEMARYLKTLNNEEYQVVDKITKGMMQKVIKLPVLQLKAACKRGEAETLIDVLNDLFNLEQEPAKQ